MITIKIASDFARYPFGRYKDDGPYSGQRFREEFLEPALRDNDKVVVVLDDAVGMGSSFLEEAFGGLIRDGLDRNDVVRRLEVVSSRDNTLSKEIAGYIASAEAPRRHAFA